MSKKLFEIMVPCQFNNGTPVKTKHHKEWDRQVRQITGGLTVFTPVKGQWEHEGETYFDRVIPVRIACTDEQMTEIVARTIHHYEQLAVMVSVVSDDVRIIAATDEQQAKFTRV